MRKRVLIIWIIIDNAAHWKNRKNSLLLTSDQVHSTKHCRKTYWNKPSHLKVSLSTRQEGRKNNFCGEQKCWLPKCSHDDYAPVETSSFILCIVVGSNSKYFAGVTVRLVCLWILRFSAFVWPWIVPSLSKNFWSRYALDEFSGLVCCFPNGCHFFSHGKFQRGILGQSVFLWAIQDLTTAVLHLRKCLYKLLLIHISSGVTNLK